MRQADGGVFRYEPRTLKFEIYVPMTSPTRTATSSTTGARTSSSTAPAASRTTGPRSRPRSTTRRWRSTKAPRPGDVRTRPVGGVEILSSRHFPDEMQGNLLVLNVIGFQGILNYKLTEDGAGLKIDRGRADPRVGRPELPPGRRRDRPRRRALLPRLAEPDHRPHAAQPPRPVPRSRHGRIYRVTYQGRPLLKPAKIAGEPIRRLLDLLKEPEDRVRYRAKIELSGRDTNEVLSRADTRGSAGSTRTTRSTSTT